MISRSALSVVMDDYTAALLSINRAARRLEDSHFSVASVNDGFQMRSAHAINQLTALYREVAGIQSDLERVRTSD